jgi:hypothetical protein
MKKLITICFIIIYSCTPDEVLYDNCFTVIEKGYYERTDCSWWILQNEVTGEITSKLCIDKSDLEAVEEYNKRDINDRTCKRI